MRTPPFDLAILCGFNGYSVDRHSITFECMMSGTKRDASAGLDPEGGGGGGDGGDHAPF